MDEPNVKVRPKEMLEHVRQLFTVERVYGEPIEVMGKTIIPVAQIAASGGGGGGEGEGPADAAGSVTGTAENAAHVMQHGSGMGFGFGGTARPLGFMVVDGDKTTWVPIVNPEKIALKALSVGLGVVKLVLKSAEKRAGARGREKGK